MMAGLLILVSTLTYGQSIKNDPTYSINNYEHSNKAADARKYNIGKVNSLESVELSTRDNYKQPFSNGGTKKSYAAATEKKSGRGTSSKHPYGL